MTDYELTSQPEYKDLEEICNKESKEKDPLLCIFEGNFYLQKNELEKANQAYQKFEDNIYDLLEYFDQDDELGQTRIEFAHNLTQEAISYHDIRDIKIPTQIYFFQGILGLYEYIHETYSISSQEKKQAYIDDLKKAIELDPTYEPNYNALTLVEEMNFEDGTPYDPKIIAIIEKAFSITKNQSLKQIIDSRK